MKALASIIVVPSLISIVVICFDVIVCVSPNNVDKPYLPLIEIDSTLISFSNTNDSTTVVLDKSIEVIFIQLVNADCLICVFSEAIVTDSIPRHPSNAYSPIYDNSVENVGDVIAVFLNE